MTAVPGEALFGCLGTRSRRKMKKQLKKKKFQVVFLPVLGQEPPLPSREVRLWSEERKVSASLESWAG